MEKILKIEDVMEMYQLSRSTIYRLIDNKKLPASKIGGSLRFKQSDLDRLWEQNKVS